MENKNTKIAICGSMEFSKEMLQIKKDLTKLGCGVILPKNIEEYAAGRKRVESKWEKAEGDLIKSYFDEIKGSDAVLIVNITKNGVENYVGGNALIEMGLCSTPDFEPHLNTF